MSTLREDFVKFARQYVGTSATGNGSEAYLDLLSRKFETAQMRKDMGKMSSCALFVRSLWWCFGAEHPIYENPYKVSYAPIDVLKIGKERKAYVEGNQLSQIKYPKPGDVFYVGENGKREHFGVIAEEISRVAPGSWTYITIDGGQGDGGRAIAQRHRTLLKLNSIFGKMSGITLVGWFDLDAMQLPGLRPELRE